MKRLLLILTVLMTTLPHSIFAETESKPVVVVLHGLGLGKWAMKRVATSLEAEGYQVVNLSYESRNIPLEKLVSTWLPEQLKAHRVGLMTDDAPLNFVTHSMGGIVLRGWLKSQPEIPPNLRRVVMFAPPNHGSSLVDRIGTWKAFKISTGVNGIRLSTAPDSYPRQIGPWPDGPELGIIAGDSPINPLLAYWTGGPGDGKVRVSETKLDGMSDHIVMPNSHTWIQYRRKPIAQVVAFLRDGKFTR